MKKTTFLLSFLLLACSDAEMVENWKNPDHVIFHANKVLLVGMTQDTAAREAFETKLKSAFDARGADAMRSLDVFDVSFTNAKRTEKELDAVEQSLLDKDFDAILLTKITGSDSKNRLRKTFSELNLNPNGFKEDYLNDQEVFYNAEYYDQYTVYHAETSLYCICVDKERSLIWRGSVDIYDPKQVSKTVDDYVKLIVMAMEEQDLVFYEPL
ncbi:hypothetical protein [Maribacter sp. 2307ULW6-5]|uniref:hypothetical protein n=1 Tax=Maribacter sp. 2307ULW6-5 TaxID=3386275 RepID=UPI0039BCACA0